MRVTMLGCGASSGVPVVGEGWGDCDPKNPKNRRRRPSILVEEGDTVVLVDTTPDLHDQLIDAGVTRLDAILYTHGHADHIHGIDDVRPLTWMSERQIPAYLDALTYQDVFERFGYMFQKTDRSPPHFRSPLTAHIVSPGDRLTIGALAIDVFHQSHGASGNSLGFLFNGRFAYSTDVAHFEEADLDRLQGIEAWIVDCLRFIPARSHANFERTLSWIARVKPKKAYFTHMTAAMDYEATLARCPPGVEPGYDGLVIEL